MHFLGKNTEDHPNGDGLSPFSNRESNHLYCSGWLAGPLLSLMVLVHFLKSCESPMVQWPQLQIKLGIFVAFNFLFLLAKFLLKQRHLSLTFWVLLISVGNLELISITFTFEIFSLVTYSSTLARKIPWMEEPHRLQSMGLQRVRHDWVTSLFLLV